MRSLPYTCIAAHSSPRSTAACSRSPMRGRCPTSHRKLQRGVRLRRSAIKSTAASDKACQLYRKQRAAREARTFPKGSAAVCTGGHAAHDRAVSSTRRALGAPPLPFPLGDAPGRAEAGFEPATRRLTVEVPGPKEHGTSEKQPLRETRSPEIERA